MKLPIIEKIHTTDDRVYLIEKLDELSQTNYSVKSTFEDEVGKLFSLGFADSILEAAKSKNINLSDPQAVQSFLEDLKTEIQSIPNITLRLAFEPSYDLLRNISIWYKNTIGTKYIVEYTYNPDIVGGVVIEDNGKYIDCSVKKIIQEKLKQNNLKQLEA